MTDIVYLIATAFVVGAFTRGVVLITSNRHEVKYKIIISLKKIDTSFLKRLKILAILIWLTTSTFSYNYISYNESSFDSMLYIILLNSSLVIIAAIKWLFAINTLHSKFYIYYIALTAISGTLLIYDGYGPYFLYGSALLYSIIPIIFCYSINKISIEKEKLSKEV